MTMDVLTSLEDGEAVQIRDATHDDKSADAPTATVSRRDVPPLLLPSCVASASTSDLCTCCAWGAAAATFCRAAKQPLSSSSSSLASPVLVASKAKSSAQLAVIEPERDATEADAVLNEAGSKSGCADNTQIT